MKILFEHEIRKAIASCGPSKIAVAYIGADWTTFVPDVDKLNAVIVSPTIGSNPRAIANLAKRIGWGKVYFLDELHAKMYIGNKSAIIGSANLTSNGLSGEGLVELCVAVYTDDALTKLNTTFDELKNRANAHYPSTQSKKSRLSELESSWGAAIANRIAKSQSRYICDFSDFELLDEDHIYVCWAQPGECEYSGDVADIQSLIADDIHFSAADKVKKNKWVLVWRLTDSSLPHRTAKPHWLYIHEIYQEGIIDKGYDYPQCAIQRSDLDVPTPPFEITHDVAKALKTAIQERDLASYLIQEHRPVFDLAYSLKGIPSLMRRMKELLAREK